MNPVTKTMPRSMYRPVDPGNQSLPLIIKTGVSVVTRPCDLCGSRDLAIKQSAKFYCHSCAGIVMQVMTNPITTTQKGL